MNIPVKEGREKLERILSALVDAPDCYIPVRGPWVPLSEAQQANWDARQTISKLLRAGSVEPLPTPEEQFRLQRNADMGDAVRDSFPKTREQLQSEETPARVLVEAKQATLFS